MGQEERKKKKNNAYTLRNAPPFTSSRVHSARHHRGAYVYADKRGGEDYLSSVGLEMPRFDTRGRYIQ